MRYFWVTFSIILLDQWSKWQILKTMDLYSSLPVIRQFFYITSHRNRGAAFGILQDKCFFLISVTIIVVIALAWLIWKGKNGDSWMLISFAVILGGAIGNFIDRIRLGEVVDFLDFRFGSYHFPIFNIADSAIVLGVSAILFISIFFPNLMTEKDRKE